MSPRLGSYLERKSTISEGLELPLVAVHEPIMIHCVGLQSINLEVSTDQLKPHKRNSRLKIALK